MRALGNPGMALHKFSGMEAKPVFQPDHIVWIEIHLHFMTTNQVTTHLGMTVKMKSLVADWSSSFGNREWLLVFAHRIPHKKRPAGEYSPASLNFFHKPTAMYNYS